MSPILKTCLATAVLVSVLPLATPARAQATSCANKAFFNSIYVVGTGANTFEYFFQIQNRSRTVIHADVRLGGFPRDVTLFSPALPGISLAPYEQKSVRFGRGTNANINMGTVASLADTTGSGRPYVSASNCRS